MKAPHELWDQARREAGSEGQSERYAELMREHGHVLPIPPCSRCGKATNHRHDDFGSMIPTDIFGHDKRPLTEAQVDELPAGTLIEVIWSGGNGPHRYKVHVEKSLRYAGPLDGNARMLTYNPLGFVGVERFHTRVWLVAVAVAVDAPAEATSVEHDPRAGSPR